MSSDSIVINCLIICLKNNCIACLDNFSLYVRCYIESCMDVATPIVNIYDVFDICIQFNIMKVWRENVTGLGIAK